MSDRIIVMDTPEMGLLAGIRAVREAFNLDLRDAKHAWEARPKEVYPENCGVKTQQALAVLRNYGVWFLYGNSSADPILDPFECAACGSRPSTWIDPELFLDGEHIELFGRRLLCSHCWQSPMGDVLIRMEKRLRPQSRWDFLMDREETCLT
jgi:hypothetical protein